MNLVTIAGREHTNVASPRMYVSSERHGTRNLTQAALLSASQIVQRLQQGQYKHLVDASIVTSGAGRMTMGPCLSMSIIAHIGSAAALGILTCLPYEDSSHVIQHRDVDPYLREPLISCRRVNDSSIEPLYAKATMSQFNTIAIPFMLYLGLPIKEDMTSSTHESASYVVSGKQLGAMNLRALSQYLHEDTAIYVI